MLEFREKYRAGTPLFLQNKWVIFFMVTLSTMLDLLSVSSLLVSTKFIHQHYHVSPAVASWTLSAYAVTFSGFIAFQGRVGDIIGHDIQFILNSIFFAIASLICALVDNIYVYIVFRAIQGIGAAGLVPSNYAITANLFQGKQLNITLVFLNSVLGISAALGMLIGGAFLTTGVNQHGIGYVTCAISLILGIIAFFSFPQITRSKDKLKNLDYLGSIILISGLLLIIVGFTEGGESWKSPKSYVILIIGFILVLCFFIFENYLALRFFPDTHLLIPPMVWKIPNFTPLVVISILNFSGYFGNMFVNTSYSLNIDGVSPLVAAVRYLPFIVTMLVVTFFLALSYGKVSEKWISTLGFLIGTGGLVVLSRMNYRIDNYYWKFSFTGQIALALGSCLYFVHYLNMIITATPLEVQGIVSGIAQTFAQFGIALSFAVITSIVGDRATEKESLHQKYQYGSYFCLACYALGTLLLLLFVRDVKEEEKIDIHAIKYDDKSLKEEIAPNV
ncbi:hypothetical protein DASC09_042120 [Saccharomycopsis crataegensis]|uniref:Major facilitator superfamily (MFS) profile domain-containing protein n=1 Tax=Saccharomycopsis crataegensis TaxID=43959 RepID=A0AAV5QQK2_9ASCO|nr:hypothetical protein DASC09_042120 [Saccharomycopsis crataegensis]